MLFKSGRRRNQEKRNVEMNGVLSARIGERKKEIEAICRPQGKDVSEFVREALTKALDAHPLRPYLLCVGASMAFRDFTSAARDSGIVGDEIAEKLRSLLDEFSAQAQSGLKQQFRSLYPESQDDPANLYPVENFSDLQTAETLMRSRTANDEIE